MIPKIIHQIWVGDFKIPTREMKLVEKMKEMHPSFDHILWEKAPPLPENVQYWYDIFYQKKNYAFCADILRMFLIMKYGGFYLDVDFDLKKELDPFFEKECVLFYHNEDDKTIPNNIFASKADTEIFKFCVENITEKNSWYGPSWFGSTVKNFLKLQYNEKQQIVKSKLNTKNIDYLIYSDFENTYAKHLSLYSWSPEVWNRLNNNEQL